MDCIPINIRSIQKLIAFNPALLLKLSAVKKGKDLFQINFKIQHIFVGIINRIEKNTFFELPEEKGIIIFDEIHKYSKWKTLMKGIYDTNKDKYEIILTGSSHLNIYGKGRDSLHGRYHYYTLHPFSVAE
jgi:predicted AAA+ superfamily ATPase